MAGIVLVKTNSALWALELSYVLKQSRASGLIYTAAFRNTNMAEIADQVAPEVREIFCHSEWRREVLAHDGPVSLRSPADGRSRPTHTSHTSRAFGCP